MAEAGEEPGQVRPKRAIQCWSLIPMALIGLIQSSPADAESDYFAFPYVESAFSSGLSEDSQLEDDEYDYGLDLFAAVETGGFLFLGEALLAKHEQEIERLQLGYRFGDSRIWLGRFHNPIGYWNSQYHHGAFLETSISRPTIVDFEDDGGPLPMHLAGLLIEGAKEGDSGLLGYSMSIAGGPELGSELESFDVLNPTSGTQGLSLTMNLFREPVAFGRDRYGLFANYTEIPAEERGFEDVRQFGAGAYWNWEPDSWRLIGSVFYIRNRLSQAAGTQVDEFVSSYIQIEKSMNENWTMFGRFEKTFADDDDLYLGLFADFIRERMLGGVRVAIHDRHALKLELSTNRTLADRYHQVRLQWDAMFILE